LSAQARAPRREPFEICGSIALKWTPARILYSISRIGGRRSETELTEERMNGMMKRLSGLLCAAGLFATAAARADIPPPDVCKTENAVCHNAGESYDKDGVCTVATCSKGSASGQVTTYDCLKCESGTAGVAGAAGASTVPITDGSTDDGGCTVRALGTEKGVASLMLGLGLLVLGISRRHR
jgi:hypothetical protein